MRDAPPQHENHYHFARQYETKHYVVYDTTINGKGDTFRIWLPKGLNLEDDHVFPAFCSKTRYGRARPKAEPRGRKNARVRR